MPTAVEYGLMAALSVVASVAAYSGINDGAPLKSLEAADQSIQNALATAQNNKPVAYVQKDGDCVLVWHPDRRFSHCEDAGSPIDDLNQVIVGNDVDSGNIMREWDTTFMHALPSGSNS